MPQSYAGRKWTLLLADSAYTEPDSVPVEGLSKEEAIRILEAMREQEKELQKQKARQVKVKSRRVEKEW